MKLRASKKDTRIYCLKVAQMWQTINDGVTFLRLIINEFFKCEKEACICEISFINII